MSVLAPEEMTRADLIATVRAAEAKLKSVQARNAVLEARLRELEPLAQQQPMADDIHDD